MFQVCVLGAMNRPAPRTSWNAIKPLFRKSLFQLGAAFQLKSQNPYTPLRPSFFPLMFRFN